MATGNNPNVELIGKRRLLSKMQGNFNNSTQCAPTGLGPRLRSAAGAGRYTD